MSFKSPMESTSTLMDTHFPGSEIVHTERTNTEQLLPLLFKINETNEYITPEKVEWSIDSFSPDKAPGPDGIKAQILQNLEHKMLARLTHLYQMILQLQYTPISFREAEVKFIPKVGKTDYNNPKSFRPITLTNILFKAMEKIILNHIEYTIMKNNPIHKNQHAFRKGSSCDTALSDMTDNIEKAILQNNYALAVFLDIAGAFDNVKLTSITNSMRNRQCRNTLLDGLINTYKTEK